MIVIYGTSNCGYCKRAKELCAQYQLPFSYYQLDSNKELQEQFKQMFPEAKTVPQILWNGKHVGGYAELTTEIENLNLGNFGQGAF